jgi:TonB-linked SusC/RagA family outer membrane protein
LGTLHSVANRAHSQTAKLSLLLSNVTIQEVLTEIENKSGFHFTYNTKKIDANRKVSVDLEDKTVSEILNELFLGKNIGYTIEDKHIVLYKKDELNPGNNLLSLQQNKKQISGIVTDENGDMIIGANVVEKGTTNGVITDVDGQFTLSVAGNGILEVSYIGYITQNVSVSNQTSIVVVLKEDTQILDEVVVVGYGSQSKRNVTGSVVKVDMKKMENLPNSNVSQALRGRVAGVQFTDNGRPGQEGTILIRGQRSIKASNNPLIIVDGMFFNGSFSEINANDVESMEILKDASASAIYGSRAANGVILVTTRKGQTEKPTIRFNTYAGVSDWSNEMKLLSPERYLERRLDYRKKVGLESDPAKVAEYLSDSERANYLAGKTIDGWDIASQTGVVQSYDLSVSGMTERINYFVSGALTKEKGIIYNDKADRLSFRMNVDTKITDWLKVGVTSQFSHRDLSGVVASVLNAYYLSPFGTIYKDDGSSKPTSRPTSDSNAYAMNPLFDPMTRKNETIRQNLFANVYALVDIPFIEGLSYRFNLSPNLRWYHKYDAIPEYKDENIAQIASASKYDQKSYDWSMENIVNYDRYFGKNHRVHATLMYGRSHRETENTTAKGSNFVNDVLGWNNLALASVQEAKSDASELEEISSMFRLNYTFMNRYLLALTARRDGCSVFGDNNKYATFPSVALAWIASDESFFKNVKPIDMLKLRLSYGKVGNQAIDSYSSLSKTDNVQYVFGDGSSTYIGIYPSSMANSSLKWETTKSMNLAVDFLLLEGRVGGTIEYYNMDTEDLLLSRAIPTMTGFTSVMSNIGATNNKGIEITLNAVNVRSGKFEWNTDITFSTNKNKIVHLYRSDLDGDGREDDDIGNKWFIGQPVSVNYDYEVSGVWQVGDDIPDSFKAGDYKIVDQNDDGVINSEDRVVLSQREPKYRWGLTNTFRYGNWSLSVFLNSLLGWESDFSLLGMMGSSRPQPNFPERAMGGIDAGWWTEENRSNSRPALTYLNALGHGFYENRNFVRIQDVSLSYEFPKILISKWKIGSLKAYVSAKNLYTFTDYVGFDPENAAESSLSYPMPRSVVGGINISF